MTPQKNTIIDIDGTEAVSNVLLELLNQFPGLGGKKILFSTLAETSGIGFFPTSGAAIISTKESITGRVQQTCAYPFRIIYRAAPKSEAQRLRIKELLDCLGRWLEQQPVIVDGTEHRLAAYPALSSGNREITSISRTNPGHLESAYQDGVEDWSLAGSLQYKNIFYK